MPARSLHEVESAHAQAGAIADDPDLSIERHIREAALLRLDLIRIALEHAAISLLQVLVPPRSILVDPEFGVPRDHVAALRDPQRVDLSRDSIELRDGAIELLDQARQWTRQLTQPSLEHETIELEVKRSAPRIRIQPRDRLRRLFSHLLDLHPTLRREHEDVGASVAIHREAEIDLALDLERGFAVDQRHLEPLDVHPDDLRGGRTSFFGGLPELDPPGLPPPPTRPLPLDGARAKLTASGSRPAGRARYSAWRDGDAKRRKDFFGLVLEKLQRRGTSSLGTNQL